MWVWVYEYARTNFIMRAPAFVVVGGGGSGGGGGGCGGLLLRRLTWARTRSAPSLLLLARDLLRPIAARRGGLRLVAADRHVHARDPGGPGDGQLLARDQLHRQGRAGPGSNLFGWLIASRIFTTLVGLLQCIGHLSAVGLYVY